MVKISTLGVLAPWILLLSPVCHVVAVEWPFDLTTLTAPDGSITAKFVSLGATMTELWVPDRNGEKRDIILGYDDNSKLLSDPDHPVFNPIVGRYANRLKNGSFSIPIVKDDPPSGANVYHIPTNDHDGLVTLHGGIYGWDRRTFTIVSKNATSVTYKHVDNADEGWPGIVSIYATHTVSNGGVLTTSLKAYATEPTPLMTTQHIYWNLNAFQDGSENILDHTLFVDSSKVLALDTNAIPTGEFIDVTGNPFDFRTPKTFSERWNETVDLCGSGCQGYDSSWIYDNDQSSTPGVSLWSNSSGIRLDITTDQPAVQVYTSFWVNTPRKATHGGPSLTYSKWSAVAIEQEGYIDAVHNPEWNVDQIYSPDRDFAWRSTYKFSTIP